MTNPTDISPLTRVVARVGRTSSGEVDPGLVPTRFPSIDRAIGGGFRRGDLIGSHADLVFGLYREERYEADLGVSGAAELLLLKNRRGAKGYVDLYFDSRFSRFEDVLEE
jgi:replicative DNA helicase